MVAFIDHHREHFARGTLSCPTPDARDGPRRHGARARVDRHDAVGAERRAWRGFAYVALVIDALPDGSSGGGFPRPW